MRVQTALLASLLALHIGGADAQSPTPPASVYVTCYGPVPGNIGPRPDKVYFAGVSTVPVTLSYKVKPAFIAYAKQKYRADFDPRCDFSPTEAAARDYLKAELNVLKDSAVETGWTWTPSPADSSKPPASPPRTGGVR